MNIANQEVESIYQAITGSGEKIDEQLGKKKQQLEAVEKELDRLQKRRTKLRQEIKSLEYNANASKHSNMLEELGSFGIDLDDKKTMQEALRLIIENMGKEKNVEAENSAASSSGEAVETKQSSFTNKSTF